MSTPKVNSAGQKELDRASEKFEEFSKTVAEFNPLDMKAPVVATEPQTQLSKKELKQADALYIKPIRSISRNKTFWDEKNRAKRDFDWEYLRVIIENNEIIGEAVECWTGKWGCDPAHHWKIPANKPVMIPRHLAKQLSECKYHRLVMQDAVTSADGYGSYVGTIVVDTIKARIDCRPAANFDSMASSF